MHWETTRSRGQLTARGWFVAAAVTLGLILLLLMTNSSAGATPMNRPLPDFAVIQGVVQRHFLTETDYKPGDIITRSQVESALEGVEAVGWRPLGADTMVKDTLEDQAFLPRSLRTDAGLKFMQQIKGDADAYDRLDRLSAMPHGRADILAMIKGPDGWKLIDYMTQTQGGENLGKQISNAPTGHNFNKPTGRIYTEADLLSRLKTAYDREAAARAK